MLLFIISVRFLCAFITIVSIHLMLLFIFVPPLCKRAVSGFQYISCYSLSPYHGQVRTNDKFQYISCYSLSTVLPALVSYLFLFQYISCYSLSQRCHRQEQRIHVSIHLMLLFIGFCAETVVCRIWVSIHLMLLFIKKICDNRESKLSFNTSHVTLYR